jgi:hypothetical protein
LGILFGFEGHNLVRLLGFGDEMLGVQFFFNVVMLNRTKGSYFENPIFFPIGNTVKLKMNYWQEV